jgi:YesN/AraC family two-component response regulator
MSPSEDPLQAQPGTSVFALEEGQSVPSFIEARFPDLLKGSAEDLQRAALNRRAPSIVLLAIGTDFRAGIEILKRIKEHGPNLPVVVLSATRSLECSEACANFSTQGYFVMPYDQAKLCQRLEELLPGSERRRIEILEAQVRDPTVKRALGFISENCHLGISSRHVAGHVCLSRNHFAEKFKKETGLTLRSYINMVRIQRAKELMVQNPFSRIVDIAERTGFSDVYYFSRAFRKSTSRSPREFKKSVFPHT